MDTFATRLRATREGKDWTRHNLAVAADIPEGRIAKYEQGTFCPASDALFILADALGIKARWLLTGHGPKLATKKRSKKRAS